MNKIYQIMSLAAIAFCCLSGCDDDVICIHNCETAQPNDNNNNNNDNGNNDNGNNDNGKNGNNDNGNNTKPQTSCDDGIKNGNETDIDCGGSCTKCAENMHCYVNADCLSDNCDNDICQIQIDPCEDGILNGDESSIDCGGSCAKCADGIQCHTANDCSSGFCDDKTCTSCSDGIKNGNESDIDCGGRCGATCTDEKPCNTDNDCTSYNCVDHVCKAIDCPDTAATGEIIINEVFANPDTSAKMQHSTNPQMKYIELYNKSDKTLQLYNLSLTYEGHEIQAKGCIPAQTYLILHPAGQTLTALDMDAKTLATNNLADALSTTSGNIKLVKRTDSTIIHSAVVPETEIGTAAGREQDENNSQSNETMVPHTSVKTLESGVKNFYSPGLPNNAGFPMG